MIVEPVPGFPLLPTAMQSFALAHERLSRSKAFAGTLVWLVHVDPLFSVPTTYGVELKVVPTPRQFVPFTHAISAIEPVGIDEVLDQVE
jgi:hypothetical protein